MVHHAASYAFLHVEPAHHQEDFQKQLRQMLDQGIIEE